MSANNQSVAILGCGWFGLSLAESLLKQGFIVKGTKRSAAGVDMLRSKSISAMGLDLDQPLSSQQRKALHAFLDVDYLVVNIPPNMRAGRLDYLERVERLYQVIALHDFKKLIFISTTGVYDSKDAEFDETQASAHSERARILLDAEDLYLNKEETCVLRFAGLVGPKRHPGRFMAGKSDLSGGNCVVNLVHLEDCIGATHTVLQSKTTSPVYNLCSPHHPTRKDFYSQAAVDLQCTPPQFNAQHLPSKVINGHKITEELGFQYRYSNLVDMLKQC